MTFENEPHMFAWKVLTVWGHGLRMSRVLFAALFMAEEPVFLRPPFLKSPI